MKPVLPPSYVTTPVPIAYAEVDDTLIVTMTRILGLCWAYDYERTPALTPEQVAELTSRPRSTLYRYLKQLRDMHWLRIDQAGRRIIIRPAITRKGEQAEKVPTSVAQPTSEPAPSEALLQVLADIGIKNPKRSQLAGLDIDPLWVRAWHLWARHPRRQSLTNPVGKVILKLESGEPPPSEFLRAVQLAWKMVIEAPLGHPSKSTDLGHTGVVVGMSRKGLQSGIQDPGAGFLPTWLH